MPIDVTLPTSLVQRVQVELNREPLEVITGLGFHDQNVYLDGRLFERCRFDRCRLFATVGSFRLDGCTLNQCNFILDGPAEAVRRLVLEVQNSPQQR